MQWTNLLSGLAGAVIGTIPGLLSSRVEYKKSLATIKEAKELRFFEQNKEWYRQFEDSINIVFSKLNSDPSQEDWAMLTYGLWRLKTLKDSPLASGYEVSLVDSFIDGLKWGYVKGGENEC